MGKVTLYVPSFAVAAGMVPGIIIACYCWGFPARSPVEGMLKGLIGMSGLSSSTIMLQVAERIKIAVDRHAVEELPRCRDVRYT